jgi:hypothetical protein
MVAVTEPEEEKCPNCDEEYVAVDYLFKDIQKWREDVSSTILDTEVNK